MQFPLEILLSNERGFTLNFTSILDVVDLLLCISCIIHFPSAALSALTASSAVLLLNKDISNFLSQSRLIGLFSSSHLRLENPIPSLHPGFVKTFVKCTFALDAFFHAAINVEKMVEGLYPALMARIPICHPPSGQSTSS